MIVNVTKHQISNNNFGGGIDVILPLNTVKAKRYTNLCTRKCSPCLAILLTLAYILT